MFNEVSLIGKLSSKTQLVDLDGRGAVKIDMEVIHDDDHDKVDYITSYFYSNNNILSQCEEEQKLGIFGHVESINNATYIIVDVFQLV